MSQSLNVRDSRIEVSTMGQYPRHLALLLTAAPLILAKLQIEEVYSHSFMPAGISVSWRVDNMDAISFNLSVQEHFAGKLLMHIFIRKLAEQRGGPTANVVKLKNLDFCKSLEMLRNMTMSMGKHLLPSTFLISCPLTPGFYYMKNEIFDLSWLPYDVPPGRYFAQFELIQVYEEVTKLVNIKIKARVGARGGEEKEGKAVMEQSVATEQPEEEEKTADNSRSEEKVEEAEEEELRDNDENERENEMGEEQPQEEEKIANNSRSEEKVEEVEEEQLEVNDENEKENEEQPQEEEKTADNSKSEEKVEEAEEEELRDNDENESENGMDEE